MASTFFTPIQNSLGILARSIRQEEEMRRIQIGKN
jgi:hypothetical protein